MWLVLILLVLIAFIVYSTVSWKLHPFLALLAAAILAGFAYQVPVGEILKTVASDSWLHRHRYRAGYHHRGDP